MERGLTSHAPFQKAGIANVAASEGRLIVTTREVERTIRTSWMSAGPVISIVAMTEIFIPLASNQESVESPIAGASGRRKM
jgi:hypothetical protein